METLVTVTIPVFGIILTGYLAGKFGLLSEHSAKAINAFVYYFSLPALLFLLTTKADFAEIANFSFILVFVLGTVIVALIAAFGGRAIFGLTALPLTIHAMVSSYGNTGYMGVAIFLIAFGPGGVLPAIVATITANILVIGIGLTLLEGFWEGAFSQGPAALRVSKSLILNPLIMAPLLGLVVAILKLKFPAPITNYLDLLGSAAAPSALFSLGLSMTIQSVKVKWGEIAWLTVIKLLVQPLVTLAIIVYLIPLPSPYFEAAIILAALPTGASLFVIAEQYGSYTKEASAMIVCSTAGAVFTISTVFIALGI